MNRATVAAFGRAVVAEWRAQNVTFMAASLAYYAFISLIPLSLVALAVGTTVFGEEVAEFVVVTTQNVLTPVGQDDLVATLLAREGRMEAFSLGTLVLLWSGLKLFRSVDIAFERVYRSQRRPSLVRRLFDALTVLAVIATAAFAVVLLGGLLPSLPGIPLASVVAPLGLTLALVVVFLPIYYVFPPTELSVREAVPGAVVAAVGWTLLTALFRVYALASGRFELYGLLGGALVLLTWLYGAGIVIILGAVVNAVLSGRTSDDAEETESPPGDDDGPAPDITSLERDLRALESDVDARTVDKSALERELKRYVRGRLRRGHARGWGPYLVLLYGTAMTLGAFYYLRGGWAILAMVVLWLSTLGLYVLMLLVGVSFNALGLPGRAVQWVRDRRT
ncbi:YihY/virulence factor BrkB family protein [Halobacteriaceae archaeon GCM10025711]